MPINKIVVENSRIDPKADNSADLQRIYRAAYEVVRQQLNLLSVKATGDGGQWEEISLTPAIRNQFQVIGSQIGAIEFTEVQRKDRELANLFKAPEEDVDDKVFDALKAVGVFKTGFKNSTFVFDSVGGEVSVETADGVVVTLYIGSIAEKSDAENLQLSRYVIVSAGVDESILEEPKKPTDTDDAKEKSYLRQVEERKTKIRSAQMRASEFNQRHADWIYIVSEDVIEKIRPDVDFNRSSASAARFAGDSSESAIPDAKKADSEKP